MELEEIRKYRTTVRLSDSAQFLVNENYWKMARPERFELPTAWFVARYSIQLSYGRK